MGMAASQARYLALLARKSNCEYEGQQINQSRLALSNQSADLFNQMMGLQVPSTPSKSDYTIQKYVFNNGMTEFTIDKWNKLSDSEGDGYNYAITYHYKQTAYTGYQKYKLNPQVKFSGVAPTRSINPDEEVRKIQGAIADMETKKAAMDLAYTAYETQKQQAAKISNYTDSTSVSNVSSCTTNPANTYYNITCNPTGDSEKTYTYTKYSSLSDEDKEVIKTYVSKLIANGALSGDVDTFDYDSIYYYKNADYQTDSIAFKSDLDNLMGDAPLSKRLPVYHVTYDAPAGADYVSMKQMDDAVQAAYQKYILAKSEYDSSVDVYEKYDVPVSIGNIKVTPLASMNKNQMAAITQIIKDMKEENIDTNITRCFDTMQEQYDNDTYIGGIYTFEMAGTTYYTTYYDMFNSIINGTGINSIDDQAKLPYYGAMDVDKPETVTTRALIEKDSSGRFVTVRLEDDSLVYDLKSVSETDEVAYEDAMNEYTYQRALYDKQVSDINAKTSIIQRQDQNLELRLKQLDTEQSALNTEIDAVSKVVKDNIEKSFKTFSG